jgi:outer membrane lipoprotein-sorting protein
MLVSINQYLYLHILNKTIKDMNNLSYLNITGRYFYTRTNLFYTIAVIILILPVQLIAQDATEIVRKADEKWTGEESSESHMTMTIVRPTWERTLEFRNWSKGRDRALTVITAPARERGQAFLMRDNEMWNWMPGIERMVKLPPAMMSDGWMGSDYTNDDILRESSIVMDYTHRITGSEQIKGYECWLIELVPHEDAPVVWGKIVLWISQEEYMMLKSEYYDEDNYLIKTEVASEIMTMDGREIPTRIEVIPADKNNQKTVIELNKIEFNRPVEDAFFSQQNMRRVAEKY